MEEYRKFRYQINKLYNDLETELADEQELDKIKRIIQKYDYLIDDLVSREKRLIYLIKPPMK